MKAGVIEAQEAHERPCHSDAGREETAEGGKEREGDKDAGGAGGGGGAVGFTHSPGAFSWAP